jgi:hypothetical protein
MKTIVHDILIPLTSGVPDAVQVCLSDFDKFGRQMPFIRIGVKLKPEEKTAIDAIQKRAKRILERRTEAATAALVADPQSTVSLDVETSDEANA